VLFSRMHLQYAEIIWTKFSNPSKSSTSMPSVTGPGVKLELSLSKLFVGFSLSTLDLVAVLYIVDIKDSSTYRQPCFSSVKS
jgi:hypothetical protein